MGKSRQDLLPVRGPARIESTVRRTGYGLPAGLLQKARHRLRFLALLFFVMCALAIAVEAIFGVDETRPLYLLYSINGVASAGMYGAARSPRFSHRTALNLGLAYEVQMCLIASLGFNWSEYRTHGVFPFLTWTGIMIVMFPLIIPSRPRTSLLVAVAAAATAPLSVGILQALGAVAAVPFDYVEVSFSPAFCVLAAYAASRVVYGLNVDVAEALQIGSYRLVERLGQGGMGEVWRAEHTMLARPAAVKLIRPEALRVGGDSSAGTQVLKRFEREAQATALLSSPHTVSLYDYGATEQGQLFYVMELLDGVDLESLVERFGPLPPHRTIYLMRQAARSIHEAHSHGLIHRDIKPANLFLCRVGGVCDVVKVLDFGLVKAQPRSSLSAETRLTEHTSVPGTPAFLAPEQALAKDEVTGAADIYGLGCVTYWLLTGQLVFEGDTPLEQIIKHVEATPPRPSEASELEIPEALDRLVCDCLAKRPEDRPASGRELERRLAAIDTPARWDEDKAERWWQAHRPTRSAPSVKRALADTEDAVAL